MWIRDIDGYLVNLEKCQSVVIAGIRSKDFRVCAFFSEDHNVVLASGTHESCADFIDRLDKQLSLLAVTIVV